LVVPSLNDIVVFFADNYSSDASMVVAPVWFLQGKKRNHY
jgi:hypothetical protein